MMVAQACAGSLVLFRASLTIVSTGTLGDAAAGKFSAPLALISHFLAVGPGWPFPGCHI